MTREWRLPYHIWGAHFLFAHSTQDKEWLIYIIGIQQFMDKDKEISTQPKLWRYHIWTSELIIDHKKAFRKYSFENEIIRVYVLCLLIHQWSKFMAQEWHVSISTSDSEPRFRWGLASDIRLNYTFETGRSRLRIWMDERMNSIFERSESTDCLIWHLGQMLQHLRQMYWIQVNRRKQKIPNRMYGIIGDIRKGWFSVSINSERSLSPWACTSSLGHQLLPFVSLW